jgi:hypothetical protein
MVFSDKSPNQPKEDHFSNKVLKKGKRGNRKERLVVYEEMKSLNREFNSYRVDPNAYPCRPSSH